MRIFGLYLKGQLPFRLDAKCNLCEQPYDSLYHFDLECTNNFLNLTEKAISDFQSRNRRGNI